jgi:LacI family transcriptional regulator
VKGSIYDVARVSGVSIGTVSRVFNNKPDVAEATRLLVMDAAKRVKYMPRISTRRVNIGLLVEQIEKANEVGFISETVSTLAKHMALQGGVLELVPLNDLDIIFRNYIRGLIAVVFSTDPESLREIQHIPIVLINNVIKGPNLHYVASDHAQGSRLATEYLITRGHRRIGFLEIRDDGWGSRERQRGYREAFEKVGLKASADLMRFCGHNPAREAVVPLLEKERPTALLVCGEDLSLEVNRVLIHELKVNIPKDLSVISFETPLVSELLSPPQTTIAQPWEDMGRAAVEGVISVVEQGSKKPLQVLLPNRLIERDSVRNLKSET